MQDKQSLAEAFYDIRGIGMAFHGLADEFSSLVKPATGMIKGEKFFWQQKGILWKQETIAEVHLMLGFRKQANELGIRDTAVSEGKAVRPVHGWRHGGRECGDPCTDWLFPVCGP